jgi:hypothetical protein
VVEEIEGFAQELQGVAVVELDLLLGANAEDRVAAQREVYNVGYINPSFNAVTDVAGAVDGTEDGAEGRECCGLAHGDDDSGVLEGAESSGRDGDCIAAGLQLCGVVEAAAVGRQSALCIGCVVVDDDRGGADGRACGVLHSAGDGSGSGGLGVDSSRCERSRSKGKQGRRPAGTCGKHLALLKQSN